MKLTQFKSEFEKMINRDYFSDKIHPLRQDAFSKFLMGRLAIYQFIIHLERKLSDF